MSERTLIAKVKFWFGQDLKDLFNPKYEVEVVDTFVYVYEKVK